MAAFSAIALATAAAAQGVTKAIGQKRAGQAAGNEADYNAAVNDQNATYADTQAADALARGNQGAQRAEGQAAQLRGSQRAAAGAGGLDVNAGSSVDVQQSDSALGAFDALTIRNNAMREAYGYNVEAQQYRSGAAYDRVAGQNARKAASAQAWGTLLTTGASLYGMDYSQAGNAPVSGELTPSQSLAVGRLARRGH